MAPGVLLAALEPGELAARTFVAVAVVVVAARLGGALFRRLGQPALVGELVAGIALGPSLLGLLPGDPSAALFPPGIRPVLGVLAQLGVVVLLFIVGLELDAGLVRREGGRAVAVSLGSVALAFAGGAVVLGSVLWAWVPPSPPSGDPPDRLVFALFCGVAIAGSAFAILARILSERRLFRLPLGALLVGCAVVDDVAVWTLLGITLAVAGAGGLAGLGVVAAEVALFVAVLALVVRPLLDRWVARSQATTGRLGPDGLAVLLVGLLVSAVLTRAMGLSELLGAFLFGAFVPRGVSGALVRDVIEQLESVALLLLPVFFLVTGLAVDLTALRPADALPFVAIVAVATTGKFAGGAGMARLVGFVPRQALAIGVLLNTRGLAELAVLGLAAALGVFDGRLFTLFVAATVTTTVLAGPLLGVVYPEREVARDLAAAERARLAATEGYRVLAVAGDADAAGPVAAVARVAGAPPRGGEVLLSTFAPATRPDEVGSAVASDLAAVAAALGELQAWRHRLDDTGVRAAVSARLSQDPAADYAAQVSATTPDLVVADLGDGTLAARLLADVDTDVALVARQPGDAARRALAARGGRVRALVDGGRDGDAAVELAARLARAGGGAVEVVATGAAARRAERAVGEARRALEGCGVAVVAPAGAVPSPVGPGDEGGDGGDGRGAEPRAVVAPLGERRLDALASLGRDHPPAALTVFVRAARATGRPSLAERLGPAEVDG